jgi:DNA-binding transcriptional regulator YdaS (Cro superfamily)
MKALDTWLGKVTGRASALAEKLAVDRSHLSQVRSGLRKIPADWMPAIEEFTEGVLTIESMVMHQARGRIAARKARRGISI